MNRLFFIILVGLSHHANAAYFKYYMTKSDEVIKVIYSEDLFDNKSSRSFRIKCSNVKYLRFLYKESPSDDTYTEVDPSWMIFSEEWNQIIIPESHKTKPI
ncbi:hypothetical protein [Endozoicomonas sp. Mp262]|uniref:hypothetical protein n=1 Tax=Endozoicomonas sp. Mp262 TaxID=2919499 RepID=UPI0021E04986